MTLILCLDDRGGMTFNNRRQSRDSIVTADILKTAGNKLTIAPFSEKLFSDKVGVRVLENPLSECSNGDFCFIEMGSIAENIDKIDEIIIYKWNRLYPSDTRLDIDVTACGFSLISTSEFVGSSHEKITKEIYRR